MDGSLIRHELPFFLGTYGGYADYLLAIILDSGQDEPAIELAFGSYML